jgi:hypothetical protein
VTTANVIVLANHALAQRKRVRRFWGTMGVLLRFDDRQVLPKPAPRASRARIVRKTAFETRAPRHR